MDEQWQGTIKPVAPDQREHAVMAVKRAMRRIRQDQEAMFLLNQVAPGQEARIISLVAHGEYWWRTDDRLDMAKRERMKDRDNIAKLAAQLASAIRESPWPGLSLQEVQRPQDERPMPLADYLDWLASFTAGQVLDQPHLYPPAQSTTNHRLVMLRHIKHTLNQHGLLVTHADSDALAAALARAVMEDEDIDEETLKKV